MSILGVYQGVVQDSSGNAQASPSIEVRKESDNSLASLFTDRNGATPTSGNPFTGNSDGTFRFYAEGIDQGYKITATSAAGTQTLRNVAVGTAGELDATERIFDVRDYGAKVDGATDDSTAVVSAVAAAAAVHGTVFFPSGTTVCKVLVQDLIGLKIRGAGSGSTFLQPPATNQTCIDIFSNLFSGAVQSIDIRDLKVQNVSGASGIGIRINNALYCNLTNVAITSAGQGLVIQGSGGAATVLNCQIIGYPALRIGIGGTVTNSGNYGFVNCTFSAQGGSAEAVNIQDDSLGIGFYACYFQSNGGAHTATIKIDGPTPTSPPTPVGTVSFVDCHGESNYNSTNTAADFEIGATNKAGTVNILGGNFFGGGDGVNYERDWVRVVSAVSVTILGSVVTKLASTNGFSRAAIRFESGAPDIYQISNLLASNISGSKFSDANGWIPSDSVFSAGSGPNGGIHIKNSGSVGLGNYADQGGGGFICGSMVSNFNKFGYVAGAGGTVSQNTDKSTAVTLDRVSGQITTQASALANGANVGFTVNSNFVEANDTVVINRKSGGTASSYLVWVDAVAAGSFHVVIRNVSGGSLSEALVLQFAVLKGTIT